MASITAIKSTIKSIDKKKMYLSKTRYPISFNVRGIIQLRLHQFLRYVTFDTIRPGINLRNFLISKT